MSRTFMEEFRSRAIFALLAQRMPWLACLAVMTSACGVEDQVHQAALQDLQKQKEIAENNARKVKERDSVIAMLRRRAEEMEAQRKGADIALADAKKTMEELARAQAQAEARAAQFRKLVAQFRKMTESGKLKVEIRDNRMIVSLGDRILFDPGKTQVKKEGAETLQQVTEILKEVRGRDFQVAGHTDNAPIRSTRYRSNWDLSTARAVEVVNFMIASGMEPTRLSAAGYADQAPVGSNDSPDGRSQNRRIEITLMPNLDDLPPITEDTKQGTSGPATPPSAGLSTAGRLKAAGAHNTTGASTTEKPGPTLDGRPPVATPKAK